MTTKRALDWHGDVFVACTEDRLMGFLSRLPRSRWTEPHPGDGSTLLHCAGYGNNVAAAVALIAHGINASARSNTKRTPAHRAAANNQARVLEVLCAAGADLTARDWYGASPLDRALSLSALSCVHVLVANGVRLSTVSDENRSRITAELRAFERGVLCCRAVVVALLGLKRRRGHVMREQDRFMVREIAWAIWATRTDSAWEQLATSWACVVQ